MRESSTQSMMSWDYLPLALAAKKLGCTENALIHTCIEKRLKLFIDQTNLIFVGDDGAEIDINAPVYIDDPVYLDKLINDEESIMFFSEQYPNGFLWDLGVLEIAMFDDGNYELSNEQKMKLVTERSLSVHRDEVVTGLGVVLSHNKILIFQRDLDKLVAQQAAMKKQDYIDALRELESEKQVKSAQLPTKTIINDDADDKGKIKQKDLVPPKKSKLEEQQEAILKVIRDNEFDPMAIPGGKKASVIQIDCENKHAGIFDGSTSFDRAWDSGIGKLWKMKYHDSYARRGNKY